MQHLMSHCDCGLARDCNPRGESSTKISMFLELSDICHSGILIRGLEFDALPRGFGAVESLQE